MPSNPRDNQLMVKHSREVFISQLNEDGKQYEKTKCPICGFWVNNMKKHNESNKYQRRHRSDED